MRDAEKVWNMKDPPSFVDAWAKYTYEWRQMIRYVQK